jgi:hypothetical protein
VPAPASAVAFLGKQLQNVKPVVTKRMERLLADLDCAKFADREQAIREPKALECLGNPAARRLLDQLAAGSAATHLTREARAPLGRQARQATPVP